MTKRVMLISKWPFDIQWKALDPWQPINFWNRVPALVFVHDYSALYVTRGVRGAGLPW